MIDGDETPSHNDGPTTRDIYTQHYEQFRSMNGILYRLPIIFSSILGALYYFAFSFLEKSAGVSIFVLVFSAAVAVMCYLVTQRFGMAFSDYINNINKLDGDFKITLKNSKWPSTIWVLKCLLILSFLMSAGAAIAIFCGHLTIESLAETPCME